MSVKVRVKLFNVLITELQGKIDNFSEESQEFIRNIEHAENIEDIKKFFKEKVSVQQILSKKGENLPQNPLFWEYMTKCYPTSLQSPKLRKEFMDLVKRSENCMKNPDPVLPSSINNILPQVSNLLLSGNLDKIMKSKFVQDMSKNIQDSIENDPEFQKEFEDIAKNLGLNLKK